MTKPRHSFANCWKSLSLWSHAEAMANARGWCRTKAETAPDTEALCSMGKHSGMNEVVGR